MAYKYDDFSACAFNPMAKEKMIVKYPRLYSLIENETWDIKEHNIDALIRYIIAAYDPKSPLLINERDLNFRKTIAADIAGLPAKDEEYMDSVYSFSHPFLVDMLIKYFMRFSKSKEYAAIVVIENCFWESTKKLLEPIEGKSSKEQLDAVQKKSALKDELDKDIIRIDKLYKSFFGEDVELEKKGKLKITPEDIAKLFN